MGSFQLLEHTADVGILAQGETLAETFAQAALGMFSFMTDISQVQERQTRLVEVAAPDIESLLVAWLNELIYLFEVEELLLKGFNIQEITPTHIEALCSGESFDAVKHKVMGVKAATYHMLEVKENDSWQARVILDI